MYILFISGILLVYSTGPGNPKPYIRMSFKYAIRPLHNCLNIPFHYQKLADESLQRIMIIILIKKGQKQ